MSSLSDSPKDNEFLADSPKDDEFLAERLLRNQVELFINYHSNDKNMDTDWLAIIRDFKKDQCDQLLKHLDKFSSKKSRLELREALDYRIRLWKDIEYLDQLDRAGITSWHIYSPYDGFIAAGATGPCKCLHIELSRKLTIPELSFLNSLKCCGIHFSDCDTIDCRSEYYSDFNDNIKSIFKLIHENENTIKMYEPGGEHFNEAERNIKELLKSSR